MFLREYKAADRDHHLMSTSTDNGVTWGVPAAVAAMRSSLADLAFATDPADNKIYGVWTYEARHDCDSASQGPRERMVLTVSSDCGASWQYLMDVDNWEGNNGRFDNIMLRIIDREIWIGTTAELINQNPTICDGFNEPKNVAPNPPVQERRLYRLALDKLVPKPMPPLLTANEHCSGHVCTPLP
jgi:hypothetical protein